jgi:hypothetical protein
LGKTTIIVRRIISFYQSNPARGLLLYLLGYPVLPERLLFNASLFCAVKDKKRSEVNSPQSSPVLIARKRADKPRESYGYLLNLWFTIAKAPDIFPQS